MLSPGSLAFNFSVYCTSGLEFTEDVAILLGCISYESHGLNNIPTNLDRGGSCKMADTSSLE